MDRVLLFIPMYNCEKQIKRVINQLNSEVCGFITEVLIVDNISRDNSVAMAKEGLAELKSRSNIKTKLVQNKANYNLGGSHKVAFNYAIDNNYDYVIVLHGDDQGNINDILPYLKNGDYKKHDSMLGSRFMKGSKLVGYSLFRILGNVGVNLLCSIGIRRLVLDMGSGLNLYNVKFLKQIQVDYLMFKNNLTFNVYLLFYSVFVRSKIMFFPIEWREDDQVSNAKVMRQGIHILGMIAKYVFCKNTLFKNNGQVKQSYEFNVVYE
jgi:glycosyltransferase involved in cell wall biosynthesis